MQRVSFGGGCYPLDVAAGGNKDGQGAGFAARAWADPSVQGKAKTILVKLVSSAGTGFFYTTKKVTTHHYTSQGSHQPCRRTPATSPVN